MTDKTQSHTKKTFLDDVHTIKFINRALSEISTLTKQRDELLEALKASNKHIQEWWRPDGSLPPAKSYEVVEANDALITRIEGGK